jgi:hypothetical protein
MKLKTNVKAGEDRTSGWHVDLGTVDIEDSSIDPMP